MSLTYRLATQTDLITIVEMPADDELGRNREQFEIPLPASYIQAFQAISNDKQ